MVKYTLMLLGSRLLRVLPLRLAYWLASAGGYLAYLGIPARRRILSENIALITGKKDRREVSRLVRSAYRHTAMNTVDFLLFPSLTDRRIAGMSNSKGFENLDHALELGKGVIVVTSHLGHWEFGGILLASRGYPVVVIVESIAPKKKLFKKERIASLYREFREKRGVTVVPLEKAVSRSVGALRSNKILVMVSDRDITGQGIEVSFFGRRCRLPRGPAFFSLRMEAPIIPGYLIRERDGRYLGVVEEAIKPDGQACNEANIRELTQKVARRLEAMISKYPDQWFVFEHVGEKNGS
jgi:lauroyl/myristoyl acyltransferase